MSEHPRGVPTLSVGRRSLEPEEGRQAARPAAQLGLGPVHRAPELLDLALEGEQLAVVAPVVLEGPDQVVTVVLDRPAQRQRLVGEVAEVEGQPSNEHLVRHREITLHGVPCTGAKGAYRLEGCKSWDVGGG